MNSAHSSAASKASVPAMPSRLAESALTWLAAISGYEGMSIPPPHSSAWQVPGQAESASKAARASDAGSLAGILAAGREAFRRREESCNDAIIIINKDMLNRIYLRARFNFG